MSNRRDREKAKLILLIGDFISAKRDNNESAAFEAGEALQDFSERTRFPNLSSKAIATLLAGTADDMEEGLRRMTDIAEQLSPLRQTFQAGAEIADDGRASLFFPRAASTLVQVEELLSSLLSTAENFKDDISKVLVNFDLEKVQVLIGKVKETGDKLDAQLTEISKKE